VTRSLEEAFALCRQKAQERWGELLTGCELRDWPWSSRNVSAGGKLACVGLYVGGVLLLLVPALLLLRLLTVYW
jgi:hypothetical protein